MSWMAVAISIGVIALAMGTSMVKPGWQPHTRLVASPGNVGAPGDATNSSTTCPYSARVWVCALVVSEEASSNRAASWNASSDAMASFSPPSGTLRPGTSENVTVSISSCGGQYTLNFTGPQNTASVTFLCG